MPVPDFDAMVGAIGDDGFAVKGWVVTDKYGLLRI